MHVSRGYAKYLSEPQLKALLHSSAKKLNKRDFAIHVKLFEYLKTSPKMDKSAVSHPWWRPYLGFSFTSRRDNPRIRIHSASIKRIKQGVRQLTSRSVSRSLQQVISQLNQYLKGWWNYFGKADVAAGFKSINYWLIRRLRAIVWKQWTELPDPCS